MSSFTSKEIETVRRAFELAGIAAMAVVRGQDELNGIINGHDKSALHEVLESFRDALANLHLAYHGLLGQRFVRVRAEAPNRAGRAGINAAQMFHVPLTAI